MKMAGCSSSRLGVQIIKDFGVQDEISTYLAV